jgi:hypothetical protein
MPLWSSEMPSSRAEHNIPSDTTPRILRFVISNPPGSDAPTMANGATIPA